ncbi:MAG: AcrB/AcrD/AcrF family protein [Acidobacteriaceae bacterium]|nr:AcrB/AcrD/AcrF family protein [Acidobacteriaceae bacterium]
MFTVNGSGTAIFFCILTMIGWGSWANTQKLAGKERWPFELFYWDYSVGVALAGFLFFITLGIAGSAGMPSFANLAGASAGALWRALGAGALFNLANILLVAAIDAAGMAVAFPVGIGLALVIGTAASYIETPKGNAAYLSAGVCLILLAMFVSAAAHRRLAQAEGASKRSGLLFAIVAGLLMGFFYPELMRSISPAFNSEPIRPGLLTPYTALFVFGLGVLASSIPFNGWFMRSRHSRMSDFWNARPGLHFPGILGGVIWMIALGLNVIASGVAGPAISYALGQGATLIAALWGVFVWHEFRHAPAGTNRLIFLMFASYAAGIILIGRAILV